jgi:hypothetical protein
VSAFTELTELMQKQKAKQMLESLMLNFKRFITVTKAKHDAGPNHVGDGIFRYPHKSIGKISHQHKSDFIYVDDGS